MHAYMLVIHTTPAVLGPRDFVDWQLSSSQPRVQQRGGTGIWKKNMFEFLLGKKNMFEFSQKRMYHAKLSSNQIVLAVCF